MGLSSAINLVAHLDWHTYWGYLLFTPIAGTLYGLFGPTQRREKLMAPLFTRRLILTVWFLGGGIVLAGIGAPIVTSVGVAWALAASILAAAQLIRLKQWGWLGPWAFASAIALGIPLFFLGFGYGAFGPTTEGKDVSFF